MSLKGLEEVSSRLPSTTPQKRNCKHEAQSDFIQYNYIVPDPIQLLETRLRTLPYVRRSRSSNSYLQKMFVELHHTHK